MATPNSRQAFIDYCLRRLGYPVIEINVSDDQIEDRVDEALKFYWDYHFDGSEQVFLKYQITQQDKDNKYLPVPANVIGAVGIFDFGGSISSGNLFDIRYQIALNDLYQYTNESIVPYYVNMQRIRMYEEILVGKQPIRYNRHVNKLYVDMDWDKVNVGDYMVVVAYQLVDPDTFTDVWNDRWLAKYATALIKQQWGINLTKYNNIQLMGGITFNGQQILSEATSEVQALEADVTRSFSLPVYDMIG